MQEFSSRLAEIFQDAESVNQLFDTVCFFLLSLLGESVDENFCHYMDACAPIGNIRYYMELFDDQYSMAMQFQRDLALTLNYWHSGTLRRYEFLKSQLISLRSVEFFMKFLLSQKEAFDSYLSDLMSQVKLKTARRSQSTESIKSLKSNRPKIQIELSQDGQREDLTVKDALRRITDRMKKVEKIVENFSLYVRCIRELMEFNRSNMARIHSYQFRWSPESVYSKIYRSRLRIQLPPCRVHKAYNKVNSILVEPEPERTISNSTISIKSDSSA
ncbi:uncharacterized protein LOC141851447 [Brevipalpus obovatus]|uniref:uncharacterized protein LOC141851447 n=1 Tax=Brevipalpus obovatus TaxID=246614 RepID=UPI003D9FA0BF